MKPTIEHVIVMDGIQQESDESENCGYKTLFTKHQTADKKKYNFGILPQSSPEVIETEMYCENEGIPETKNIGTSVAYPTLSEFQSQGSRNEKPTIQHKPSLELLDQILEHERQRQYSLIDPRYETRFKLYSWNLWAVPYGSPRTLSNPRKCTKVLRELAEFERWGTSDEYIFVCLQELWAWKSFLIPTKLMKWVGKLESIPILG